MQRVVAARDVEEDVAVRCEPVRREEVLERTTVVADPVPLRGQPEVEVRLVGDVIRVGDRRDGCRPE